MKKPSKRFIEDKSFPETYWWNRLQKSGTYKSDLLYWNLRAINEETPNLRTGADVMLGFFGTEFLELLVKRLATELNQRGYNFGYVNFSKCGMQFIQNFENDNSLKIPFVTFQKLKRDGTFQRIIRPFILNIEGESKKNLRVDIQVTKKALLSYTFDNSLSLDVLEARLQEFGKMVTDHSMVRESVHYTLGRIGKWNVEYGKETWRFMENFWEM